MPKVFVGDLIEVHDWQEDVWVKCEVEEVRTVIQGREYLVCRIIDESVAADKFSYGIPYSELSTLVRPIQDQGDD